MVSETAVYVVAYLEVMPPSTDEAMALLRHYREASRQEAGHVRLEVLQQQDRANQFVLVEVWRHPAAFDAHGRAPHTQQFYEKVQPLRLSPVDARVHNGLAIAPIPATEAPGTIYVVTHADAIPPAKDEALALLKQLAASSRQEVDNVRFEVLQQHSRQNHCTIVEVWRDQAALDAHVMAAHTRQFRDTFQPMSGSLYDERHYKALH